MEAADLTSEAGRGRVGRPIRAAEVVGALSLATDLGTGQPLEHALRTAVLAVRLGELAGASAKELAVWVLFDWDAEGWQSFVSDPDVPRFCRKPATRGGRRPRG